MTEGREDIVNHGQHSRECNTPKNRRVRRTETDSMVRMKDEDRPKGTAKEFIEDFANPKDYKSEIEKKTFLHI